MRIAANHPALPGHFPGHPVVPGVVLLDAVLSALPAQLAKPFRVSGFPAVKFSAPLAPEQTFEVRFVPKDAGRMAFSIESGGATLVSGSVVFETA
jgi:3-hydroxymyristoyl/3-hydroxydecanoyl-(acyl carrier protein) dehydratase